mgnify:CR=1 FL=1
MSCQGKCYLCLNKKHCSCIGQWSLNTCTKNVNVIHTMNKGSRYEYELKLCKNCSNRGLYAVDNCMDSMDIGKTLRNN